MALLKGFSINKKLLVGAFEIEIVVIASDLVCLGALFLDVAVRHPGLGCVASFQDAYLQVACKGAGCSSSAWIEVQQDQMQSIQLEVDDALPAVREGE